MTKKYKCIFCDEEDSIDSCRSEMSSFEIEALLALWKICIPHCRELEQVLLDKEKREIEKAVA